MTAALTIRNLSKTFNGRRALKDVDLTLEPGRVHGLLGQNGSGKSTLIKILAGYHRPDPGASAWCGGEGMELGSPSSAAARGLRFVHQDLGLIETLNAVENFSITRGYGGKAVSRIRWHAQRDRTARALAALNRQLDLDVPVGELSLVERATLAIARAVDDGEDARVVVLDEPTAALPAADVAALFQVMRSLRARGIAVLFVTHYLDEIEQLGDAMTVLRDGEVVSTFERGAKTTDEIAEAIVGHRVEQRMREDAAADRSVRLAVRDLSSGSLTRLSVDIARGESVGIAGLDGSGREAVGPALGGQAPAQGMCLIDGRAVTFSDPRRAKRAGLVCLGRDRVRNGLFPTMNVRENLLVNGLRPVTRHGRLVRDLEIAEVDGWRDRLGIQLASTESPITTLSGGNQQKVLLGRALRDRPRVLVLDEPTHGVDVGAREEVHRLIEKADEDMALLVLSSESAELVRLCHRVLVLGRGRVVAAFDRRAGFTAEEIDHAQLGALQAKGGAHHATP